MAQRKFFSEIAALVEKNVEVKTINEKTFKGTLIGINPETLSLCLADVKGEEGKTVNRVFLNGKVIAQILSVEKPFDLKSLSDRLKKVFPTMIKLYEEQGFIWVMDRVKVTDKGVVEGTGPAAERVKKVFEQFISETKPKS